MEFLENTNFDFEYLGVDQNPKMIEIARENKSGIFKLIETDAIVWNATDFVFASGIFQFRDPSNGIYYKSLLREFYKTCNFAVSFNLLSSMREDKNKSENELYFTPEQSLDLAMSISGYWVIDHSYHAGFGDMTVGLHKKDPILWSRPIWI